MELYFEYSINESQELLTKYGLKGYNKPKRTPSHPTKWGMVLARDSNGNTKLIRFGDNNSTTAGKPKNNESARQKARRRSFKARHGRNIKKGVMSAAFWSNRMRW